MPIVKRVSKISARAGQTEVKKRRYGGVKEIIQANIDPAGAAGAAPAWRGSVGFCPPPSPLLMSSKRSTCKTKKLG